MVPGMMPRAEVVPRSTAMEKSPPRIMRKTELDFHSKIADGVNCLKVSDPFVLEVLRSPLESIHQCENQDYIASHVLDFLDGFAGRAARGNHIIQDGDAGAG